MLQICSIYLLDQNLMTISMTFYEDTFVLLEKVLYIVSPSPKHPTKQHRIKASIVFVPNKYPNKPSN